MVRHELFAVLAQRGLSAFLIVKQRLAMARGELFAVLAQSDLSVLALFINPQNRDLRRFVMH